MAYLTKVMLLACITGILVFPAFCWLLKRVARSVSAGGTKDSTENVPSEAAPADNAETAKATAPGKLFGNPWVNRDFFEKSH